MKTPPLPATESAAKFLRDAGYPSSADELFKEQTVSEQLRVQIKQYLDEAGKAEAEASDLKREVFRLQQKLDSRNGGNR